jgi:hypothetical protein
MAERQHFLPAGFLAGFSAKLISPARDSLLWIARRDGPLFREKAENVAGQRNLYTLTTDQLATPDPLAVDRHLSAAEPRLRAAIDALATAEDGWIAAAEWQVLVDFVASLFVRGPEFSVRFESRLGPELTAKLPPDNTSMARVIEQQRLFAPVMYANWIAARASGRAVPTNDLGYFLTQDLGTDRWGYGVPLSRDLIVALFPGPAAHTLRWSGSAWLIDIPFVDLSATDVAEMSRWVGRTALSEVYGATEEVARAAGTGFAEERALEHGWGPGLLIPSSRALRDHEMDYLRLLGLLADEPPGGNLEVVMGWPARTVWESPTVPSSSR